MSNSVLEFAKKLNKQYKSDVLTDGSVLPTYMRTSFGSLGADFPTFGGIPDGFITVIAGVYHSGKTVLSALQMANYQRKYPEKTCIYVDAENTLLVQGEFLCRMTGLIMNDENRFLRYDCTGRAAEEIFSDLLELEQCDNIGMIIIDSAKALIPKIDLDSDFEKDNGMRGTIAKSLEKFIKQMVMYLPKQKNPMIIINQAREAGKTFTGATIYKEPCGEALQFYPSLKIRCGTRKFTNGENVDLASGDDADGFRLSFKITKNRLGPMNRGGGFLTFRLDTGLDIINDTVEIITKFDYVEKPTSMTYILKNLLTGEYYLDENGEPLKFVGKPKLKAYFTEHPDFVSEYVDMVSQYMAESGVRNILDEETLKEINDQENSVEQHQNKDLSKEDGE